MSEQIKPWEAAQVERKQCACHSPDALECARMRYPNTDEPCECMCHEEHEFEEWEP